MTSVGVALLSLHLYWWPVLGRFDRIQVTTTDRGGLASAFSRLLDAEVSGEMRSEALAARGTTLRVGASLVELLEPDGAGRVQAHVAETGGGLFAAGFACRGLDALARHWERAGVDFVRGGDALLATGRALGVPGLDVVIGEAEPRRAGIRAQTRRLLAPGGSNESRNAASNRGGC